MLQGKSCRNSCVTHFVHSAYPPAYPAHLVTFLLQLESLVNDIIINFKIKSFIILSPQAILAILFFVYVHPAYLVYLVFFVFQRELLATKQVSSAKTTRR